MTEPSSERIERALRVWCKPSPEVQGAEQWDELTEVVQPWLTSKTLMRESMKRVLATDDSALSHRITELEAQLAAERKLSDEMGDTLLEVLHHAIGAGSNLELTHSHPEKASEIDWIGRYVRDCLSHLPKHSKKFGNEMHTVNKALAHYSEERGK